MARSSSGEITRLLSSFSKSRDSAAKLFTLVYGELHTMAARLIRREPTGHSIGPSDLVNEAYLRLGPLRNIQGQNRAYFFGAAHRAMRRVLIDRGRARSAERRGGGRPALPLQEVDVASREAPDLLTLQEALDRLRSVDSRMAGVVELHGLWGKSIAETSEALGIAQSTVRRDWLLAKLWLRKEMEGSVQ
jgi:RNA polymerase sigma factor (TIGR02999 family)